MSDEAQELDGQELDGQEQEQEQHQEQQQEETPKGHMSKEAWVEQGKDPEEWRSPEVFAERGKWINETKNLKTQIDSLKTDFSGQIQSLNQLHQIQMAQKILDLEAQRDSAIGEADTEQANVYQAQIDQTRKVQNATVTPAQQPGKDPAISTWEESNPWVMNPDDPKTVYANNRFANYQQQGLTPDAALKLVDSDISKAFPNVNPNRNGAAMAEGSRGPGGKRAAGPNLSMTDLTREEQNIYRAMPNAWKSEADFLKAVSNDRKGAQQ